MKYRKIKFLLSAVHLEQLPKDKGFEVAMIGRSNVGKSATINVIAGSKKMARSGKTPGITRMINVYSLDNQRRLIDLPGYGYTKTGIVQSVTQWQLVSSYLQKRYSLQGLLLLIDIRHPLSDLDRKLLLWAQKSKLPIMVLLTKADKLKHTEAEKVLLDLKQKLKQYKIIDLQIFSTKTHVGLKKLLQQLDDWLHL